MNRWSIILLMLSHCYCTLVINSTKSVTGIVGESISWKWEMKNDGNIYGPEVYTNNWISRIIDDTGDITDEGKKLFGKRISRIWKKIPVYYFEVTITNLSYSDSLIFQVRVVYEDKFGPHIKQDNTSNINVEVKGGVEKCGKQLEDTIEFDDDVTQTFHLCGNPQPKVSYQINGEMHFVSGTLVDKKTRKYQYKVNLKMEPFFCGKTIKFLFTGLKNHTHEIELIPKRVKVVRYELNAANCTTVEWEQVIYGTCYSDLKYNLTFITHDGFIYYRVTNRTNQTTFVDCQDKNLQDANSLTVRVVHKNFTGEPSRNVTRRDLQDHSGTTAPTVTNSGIPTSNRMLLIIILVSTVLVLFIIVFCFCMFKTNQHFRDLFLKTSSRGIAEVKWSNSENLDNEKKVLQMENGTTGKSNAKSPKSPSMDEDSCFIDKHQSTYAEFEPPVSAKQPATPVYAFVEHSFGNERRHYALVSESVIDLTTQQTYAKPCLDCATIPGESDEEVPQRQLETDNGANLKSYDPNGHGNYTEVKKDDIKHPPSNPEFHSEYDAVIDPPKKEIPTYAVVDKSLQLLRKQEDLNDANPTDSSSSQPLLPNAPPTKDGYEEVTSVFPGKSYRRKGNKGTSRSDYDEIDQYAQL